MHACIYLCMELWMHNYYNIAQFGSYIPVPLGHTETHSPLKRCVYATWHTVQLDI